VIFAGNSKGKQISGQNINVDGAVRDEDTFVLGDDEDDESGDEQNEISDRQGPSSLPPPYSLPLPIVKSEPFGTSQEAQRNTEDGAGLSTETSTASKYYIKPNDNLQGIALRFGVNGRELCRLNNLPPSTLSTTPHILHTRAFLTLPPSAPSKSKLSVHNTNPPVDTEREARLVRERAEKRLQTLTKEVDWRVAKAYVALADDPDIDADMKWKESLLRGNGMNKSGAESGKGGLSTIVTLEGMAVDRYLDDEEWEERERREGRTAAIQPFPYFVDKNQGTGDEGRSSGQSFWRWKS